MLARRSPFFLRRDAKFLHSVAFGDGVTRARSLGPIGKTEGRVSKTTNAVLGRTSDGQSGSAYHGSTTVYRSIVSSSIAASSIVSSSTVSSSIVSRSIVSSSIAASFPDKSYVQEVDERK